MIHDWFCSLFLESNIANGCLKKNVSIASPFILRSFPPFCSWGKTKDEDTMINKLNSISSSVITRRERYNVRQNRSQLQVFTPIQDQRNGNLAVLG
jgi:hypothetical protein